MQIRHAKWLRPLAATVAAAVMGLAACAVLVSAAVTATLAQAPSKRVIQVPNQDPVMAAAIAKAQAGLPQFFQRLAKPEPGDDNFAVKIHYKLAGDNGEHIWANDVVLDGTTVSATINNEPERIPNLKYGQRVSVPVAQLSDWIYVRDAKIYGGQTIRAMLPRLGAAEAAQLKARLAPE